MENHILTKFVDLPQSQRESEYQNFDLCLKSDIQLVFIICKGK